MAASKKGRSGTQAASSATRPQAGAREGATKNTQASSGNGTNPAAPRAKAPAAKPAAPIKLTDKQKDFLRRIRDAGATGYQPANKIEQRSIDSLMEKKLLKRGKKNRETGVYSYLLTRTGQSLLPPAPAPAPAQEAAPAPVSEAAPAS